MLNLREELAVTWLIYRGASGLVITAELCSVRPDDGTRFSGSG